MAKATRRYMRLIVFFDLPTVTKAEKRAYTVFRRFLLQDGYDMIQWSVYGRMVNGFDDAEKHLKRLSASLPKCRFSIGCSPELREDEGSRTQSTSLGGPDEQS